MSFALARRSPVRRNAGERLTRAVVVTCLILSAASAHADATSSADDGPKLVWASGGEAGGTRKLLTVARGPGDAWLVACEEWSVEVWDLKTGALVTYIDLELEGAQDIAVSASGEAVAAVSMDGLIRCWNLPSGTARWSVASRIDASRCIAISRDGKTIVSGGDDGDLHSWSATGQSTGKWRAHEGGVRTLAFASDGSSFASGGRDHSVKTWSAADHAAMRELRGHTDTVACVAYDAQGVRLVSGSDDGGARVWDLSTGASLVTVAVPHAAISSVAFSPDGKKICAATDGSGHAVHVWNAGNGELAFATGGDSWASIRAVAIAPDGRQIVSGAEQGHLARWSLDTGAFLSSNVCHHAPINALYFTADGRSLLGTSVGDGTAIVRNAATGALESKICNAALPAPASVPAECRSMLAGAPLVGAAMTSDGALLAIASMSGNLRLFSTSSGESVRALVTKTDSSWEQGFRRVMTEPATLVAISPNDRALVAIGGDRKLQTWSLPDGKPVSSVAVAGEWFDSLAVTSNPSAIFFTDDNRALQCWRDGARVWSWSAKGQEVACACAFPDQSQIAIGCADHTIRILDARTARIVREMSGHRDVVTRLAYSPDGRVLVSTSEDDKTVRFWRVADGASLWIDDSPAASGVTALAFGGGNIPCVAYGHRDGTVMMFSAPKAAKDSAASKPK
jgi:WD40 repeat protein